MKNKLRKSFLKHLLSTSKLTFWNSFMNSSSWTSNVWENVRIRSCSSEYKLQGGGGRGRRGKRFRESHLYCLNIWCILFWRVLSLKKKKISLRERFSITFCWINPLGFLEVNVQLHFIFLQSWELNNKSLENDLCGSYLSFLFF